MCFGPFKKKPDEAEQHFKQAKRYANAGKKEFDLRQAIEEFRLAISLNADKLKYRAELGLTYLRVPELAVIRQVNVPFRLDESANVALREFEKVASLSKDLRDRIENKVQWPISEPIGLENLPPSEQKKKLREWEREVDKKWKGVEKEFKKSGYQDYSGLPALAYLCLGEHEKAIRSSAGLEEGWEASLPKENVSLIFKAMELQSQSEGWRDEKGIDEYFGMYLAGLGTTVAMEGKDEPSEFAKRIEEGGWAEDRATFARSAGIPKPEEDPEEARKHLEQAVMYRNSGKHADAKSELQQARQLAPDLAWWYRTLCELGS